METLNYKVLEGTGYNGYILKDAPVKVMQFGEGNFLRAFVSTFWPFSLPRRYRVYRPSCSLIQSAIWGKLLMGCTSLTLPL